MNSSCSPPLVYLEHVPVQEGDEVYNARLFMFAFLFSFYYLDTDVWIMYAYLSRKAGFCDPRDHSFIKIY